MSRARRLNRRSFLGVSGSAAATVALLGPARAFAGANEGPFGDLVPDSGGLLDLPPGFPVPGALPRGRTDDAKQDDERNPGAGEPRRHGGIRRPGQYDRPRP